MGAAEEEPKIPKSRGVTGNLQKMREGPSKEPLGEYLSKRIVLTAWITTIILLCPLIFRVLLHDFAMILIWINVFSNFIYLPAYPAFAAALHYRKWRLAGLGAVIIVCHLVWAYPDYRPAVPIPPAVKGAPALRIFSTNLLTINRTPEGITGEIHAADPDLLLLQEFSPLWVKELTEAGILKKFKYRVAVVRTDSFGTAIFSKYPLENEEVWVTENLPMTRATVLVGSLKLRLYNVHPLPPRTPRYTSIWHKQMRQLIDALAAETGYVAAIGDFNATQHSAYYRQLTELGLHSAHEDRGRGTAITFPNGLFPLPSMRLDHAFLSSGVICTSIAEGEGRGSDHKPLLVDIALIPQARPGARSR